MIIYLQTIEDPGDRAKFAELYERYRAYMLKIADEILKNPFDAEDALHNAFMKISEHLDKVADPSSSTARGFVAIIVERKAIDITNEGTPVDRTYRPTWVPSDYQMTSESESNSRTTVIYKDSSGSLAVFTYFLDTASPVFQIEKDGTETYLQVHVNEMSAELYLDQDEDEQNVLIWLDEINGVVFRISAPFGESELIKMAESVTSDKF